MLWVLWVVTCMPNSVHHCGAGAVSCVLFTACCEFCKWWHVYPTVCITAVLVLWAVFYLLHVVSFVSGGTLTIFAMWHESVTKFSPHKIDFLPERVFLVTDNHNWIWSHGCSLFLFACTAHSIHLLHGNPLHCYACSLHSKACSFTLLTPSWDSWDRDERN